MKVNLPSRSPVLHPRRTLSSLQCSTRVQPWSTPARSRSTTIRSLGCTMRSQAAQLRTRLGETEGMLATLRSRNELQARELHELRASATASSQQQQVRDECATLTDLSMVLYASLASLACRSRCPCCRCRVLQSPQQMTALFSRGPDLHCVPMKQCRLRLCAHRGPGYGVITSPWVHPQSLGVNCRPCVTLGRHAGACRGRRLAARWRPAGQPVCWTLRRRSCSDSWMPYATRCSRGAPGVWAHFQVKVTAGVEREPSWVYLDARKSSRDTGSEL